MACRGDVKVIISDPGTTFVGCRNKFKRMYEDWDQEELDKFGMDKGIVWRLIGANSQHQNGLAESMVKLIKGVQKSILNVVGEAKLSLNDTNTMLAEVTNLINERPIGLKPIEDSSLDYLSKSL